jgi:hypothetical protein
MYQEKSQYKKNAGNRAKLLTEGNLPRKRTHAQKLRKKKTSKKKNTSTKQKKLHKNKKTLHNRKKNLHTTKKLHKTKEKTPKKKKTYHPYRSRPRPRRCPS